VRERRYPESTDVKERKDPAPTSEAVASSRSLTAAAEASTASFDNATSFRSPVLPEVAMTMCPGSRADRPRRSSRS
jgi:hypothetical protein